MSPFSLHVSPQIANLLTTALAHFVWQGAALALMLFVVVRLLGIRSAQTRYLLSVATLLMIGLAPVLTIVWHRHDLETIHAGELSGGPATALPQKVALATSNNGALKHATASLHRPGVQRAVMTAWLAGVLILSIRLFVGFGITHWIRAHVTPVSGQINELAQSLGKRMRVKVGQRVFASMRIGQAVAVGFLRPVVLIPAAWLTQLTPEMLEAVIAHEFAHIRRWDLWVNLVQRFIETLLFYHPAVWWLSRRIQLEREMCCDEIAADCFDRAMYARTLESVARIAHGNLLMAASIQGGQQMHLLSRVRYLLGAAPIEAAGNWWAAGVVTMTVPLLATLLFSLTAGAISAGVLADDKKQVENGSVIDQNVTEEPKVIEKIKLLGGKITKDANLPGDPVIGVDFEGSRRFNDKYVRLLREFTSLKTLNLMNTAVTDACLKEIGGFQNLTTLYLMNTGITDANLKELRGLKSLRMLHLGNTKVTGVGLTELSELKNLETLDLSMCPITDAGLKELRDFKDVAMLSLNSTPITDVGLKELGKLKNLRGLYVRETQITDTGLKELASLTNLAMLDIISTRITDAGMVHLEGLTNLRDLLVGDTKVTAARVAKLKAALPHCEIE